MRGTPLSERGRLSPPVRPFKKVGWKTRTCTTPQISNATSKRATLTVSCLCTVVSDSPYPREAFSIGEEQDGGNGVEGPAEAEDTNECLVYEGNICHHRCINTPGSFRCDCFPGYVLQEDAFSCEPGNEEAPPPQPGFVTASAVGDAVAAGRQRSVPFAARNVIWRLRSCQEDPICCDLSTHSPCIIFLVSASSFLSANAVAV